MKHYLPVLSWFLFVIYTSAFFLMPRGVSTTEKSTWVSALHVFAAISAWPLGVVVIFPGWLALRSFWSEVFSKTQKRWLVFSLLGLPLVIILSFWAAAEAGTDTAADGDKLHVAGFLGLVVNLVLFAVIRHVVN